MREITVFLGLSGFYRKCINNFAKITRLFTLCMKTSAEIKHEDIVLKAFNPCKQLLTNNSLPQYSDLEKPFILTADANNFTIGAILSQASLGSNKPIDYASRIHNDS